MRGPKRFNEKHETLLARIKWLENTFDVSPSFYYLLSLSLFPLSSLLSLSLSLSLAPLSLSLPPSLSLSLPIYLNGYRKWYQKRILDFIEKPPFWNYSFTTE